MLQIFLVGGAVRDQLLGLPVIERDWVVVGATPEQMLALGFQPVGKEFPVFLHPKTKEEYALARTERKIGKGYKGFVFYADLNVTLVQDLERRDLTINAIAETEDGKIIDPYGGGRDIELKLLRHVSPAFAEDPVRILRIARFAAKFPDFQIHSETMSLLISMVQAGEVDALVAERVWQELRKSLSETAPERFWQVLSACGALPILFPAVKLTKQSLSALQAAIELTTKPEIRLAAFLHELKPIDISKLCDRYRLPRAYKELALLVSELLPHFKNLSSLDTEGLWNLFKKSDAFRRPARFTDLLVICKSCILPEHFDKALINAALLACQDIELQDLKKEGLTGIEIAQAIKSLQITAISNVLDDYRSKTFKE